uniref:Uncharacterized protein n=1 Tax=Anas platyrhynchos platyrhynchos TaxID=8840 RepID=A0A493T2V5_ANAPP
MNAPSVVVLWFCALLPQGSRKILKSLFLEWQQLRKWGRGRFPFGAIPAPLPPRLPKVHSQQYFVFLPKPTASACPAHGEKPGVDPAPWPQPMRFSP